MVAERALVAGVDVDGRAHADAQRRIALAAVDRRCAPGMRCTTLTQLPVAFCGGSTANSAPVDWASDVTLPVHFTSG